MAANSGCVDKAGEVQPPTLGNLLRRLRDSRRVSRERLAFNAGVSASYITHLENGNRERPTQEVLQALVRCLHQIGPLSAVEYRYLLDLAGFNVRERATPDELRGGLGDGLGDDPRRALMLHEPNLAAYLDIGWNVLACNDSFARAFPGITDDGNMLRWLLGDESSRRVLVEWEQETRLLVRWLRGLIAGAGTGVAASELLADLGRYEFFRRIWDEGIPAYGRDRPLLHLRDPETTVRRTVAVQMFRADFPNRSDSVQVFLGIATDRDQSPGD
ncbi:helix-turn-helix domain-containing protein [Nocardia otitidiscaviarum]|uniref:MmyB family transcriptional regulator n=1 Tax=Nocardia otitidiscaviarum TaxID=1823 RepID=UPI00069415AC|nr:helix-turn-helix domain-containing protein [Nocardia otitidiscaviarum]MBF6131997.1 helix-turn-helix domain-containing protein [Nocardia otitidiscaviarum]MBF6483127.1 helix-turn-helix domain-containing protein [Nocardia otitidiscaviarum]